MAKHKNKEWQEFEKLVARIEESLCPKGAIVTIDDKIPDSTFGNLRQVDVSIRHTVGSSPILIAIECRQRNTPQDITWIEQASTKRQSIKAHEIILVSSNGFTEHARQKASQLNVSLRKISKIDPEKLLDKYMLHIVEKRHTQKSVALKFSCFSKNQKDYIDIICKSEDFLNSKIKILYWKYYNKFISLKELCDHFFKIGLKINTKNTNIDKIKHDQEVMTFEVPKDHIFINAPFGIINLERFELDLNFLEKKSEIFNHDNYVYSDAESKTISETLEFDHTYLDGETKKINFRLI